MIDKNTFLRVRDWFIVCLEIQRNERAFEYDLLSHKFNFSKELMEFLDRINVSHFLQFKRYGLCDRDIWECNALDSILKEAKKLKILKKVRRDTNKTYRYDLIKELIEKMKTNRSYCMIICNFLAKSKLSEIPEQYINLCVLCQLWVNYQKMLENNLKFERELSAQFL